MYIYVSMLCMAAETPGEVMKIFAKGSSRRATASK